MSINFKVRTDVLEAFCNDSEFLEEVPLHIYTETTERKDLIKRLWTNGVIANLHSLVRYKGVWLSHAPLHPDELRGKYCCHGHTHNHCIDDPRYYNVCVDQTDMKPVLFQDVLAELKERNNV